MKKASLGSTKRRMYGVLVCFMVFGFGLIIFRMFDFQLIRGEYFQNRAIQQQTRSNILGARRGVIYDRNMSTLAESVTVWNICISPAEMEEERLDEVATRLAEILDVDRQVILDAAARRHLYYWVVARGVERSVVDAVYEFTIENRVRGVFSEQTTRRYYRYGRLASAVLGFTNADGDGAYGLEAFYNRILSGVPGRVVSTRDAVGGDMPLMYSQLYAPQDGNSLVLTIDETIQHFLERHLETAVIEHSIQNRASGIVMNVRTGEILAMATAPDFDPNDPFTLTDPRAVEAMGQFVQGTDAYFEARRNFQFEQWRNRSISDPYEPGSTFKLITAAVAVDNNLVSMEDTFMCTGVFTVSGHNFRCWRRAGHGSLNFLQTMQTSCNPAYIMIGQRAGARMLYDYIENFGLREITGIDLPGEATGIGHSFEVLNREGRVELSSTSFGQSMTVTPLQLITATAATINGGYLMRPHVVRQVLDPAGNIIDTVQPTVRRQVISAEASNIMRQLAYATVDDGSGRLSAVPGYAIGGKTGTSQDLVLGTDGGYILSFVGFAPMDNPEIAILVLLDNPELDNVYGSVIAAPVVGAIFNEVLPYLGIQPRFTSEQLALTESVVPNIVGAGAHSAQAVLRAAGLDSRLVGTGGEVISQVPLPGQRMPRGSTVILYTEEISERDEIILPDVRGLSAAAANTQLVGMGLNIELGGEEIADGVLAVVGEQWPLPGAVLSPGDNVVLSIVILPPQAQVN